jgi:AcrR family transcriptional regulator
MITEAKFKYALKDMLKTMPLEDINVTTLCAKIGCHRQTFYYHYQDIYDLIAAILLNEDIPELEEAKDPKTAMRAFLLYVRDNFSFFRATYNSAARDLTDDFIFGKLNAKFFTLWSGPDKPIGVKKEGARSAARRFAHIVADEFGYCFKDQKLTPERFATKIGKFMNNLVTTVLPSVIALSKKEEGK